MKLFEQEKIDGLSDIITNASIAFQVIPKPTSRLFENDIQKVIAQANPDQFDLYYMDSILASVGWNGNDDIFDREETWAARNTPVDKLVNYMHDEKDIIGHMTSSFVLVEDDLYNEDECPEFFDIGVQSVLYKHWNDAEKQEFMDNLISEIEEGKWAVSMECLFRDFDYGLITPTGEQLIVKREESTAFLTKHLRVYGGAGEFKGHKLGRLLRNYTFSGKGIVDTPANKRSLVLNTLKFLGTKAKWENTMADEVTTQLTRLESELEKIKAEKVVLENKLADMNKQEYEETIASLTEVKGGLETELKDTKSKLQEAEAKVAALEDFKAKSNEQVASVTSELEKTKSDLLELQTQIENIEKSKVTTARVSTLVEAGVEKTKAEELVGKFDGMSDETFTEIVSLYASIPTTRTPEETIVPEDVETSSASVVTGEDTGYEQSRAAISSFLIDSLKKKGK